MFTAYGHAAASRSHVATCRSLALHLHPCQANKEDSPHLGPFHRHDINPQKAKQPWLGSIPKLATITKSCAMASSSPRSECATGVVTVCLALPPAAAQGPCGAVSPQGKTRSGTSSQQENKTEQPNNQGSQDTHGPQACALFVVNINRSSETEMEQSQRSP